jgi:hypothetical protein
MGAGCGAVVVFSVAGTLVLASLLECSSNKEHDGRKDKLGQLTAYLAVQRT